MRLKESRPVRAGNGKAIAKKAKKQPKAIVSRRKRGKDIAEKPMDRRAEGMEEEEPGRNGA